MNTEYAHDVIGLHGQPRTILDTAGVFTLPVLANLMIRPGDFMFDFYTGPSFFGNRNNVSLVAGTAMGHKIGPRRSGFLFADARFGWSEGERFWSVGLGYEYIIGIDRLEDGRIRHSIVAPADTFVVELKVNEPTVGTINPAGELRIRGGQRFDFASVSTNPRWALDSILVNDTVFTGRIDSVTIDRMRDDMRILAMFSPTVYSVKLFTQDPNTAERMLKEQFDVTAGVDTIIRIRHEREKFISALVLNGVDVPSTSITNTIAITGMDRDVEIDYWLDHVKMVEIKPTPTVQDGIYFDIGRATLTANSRAVLQGKYLVMQEHPDINVEIMGHTDNTGGHRMNMGLSHRRAQSVVDYLIERGIDPMRLRASGFGPDVPIADNKTAAGRTLNRRVEIRTFNMDGTENPGALDPNNKIDLHPILPNEEDNEAEADTNRVDLRTFLPQEVSAEPEDDTNTVER